MEITLIILGILCLIIGIAGDIIPGLPGVPFSYVALLLLHFTDKVQFTWHFLLLWAVVTIVAQVLDYVVPAWGTKKFGGSKRGVWGSTIGIFVGMFLGPMGVIIGPFIGAFLGELTDGKDTPDALRAGLGSFLGIMAGTVIKLVCSCMMTFYFIRAIFFA